MGAPEAFSYLVYWWGPPDTTNFLIRKKIPIIHFQVKMDSVPHSAMFAYDSNTITNSVHTIHYNDSITVLVRKILLFIKHSTFSFVLTQQYLEPLMIRVSELCLLHLCLQGFETVSVSLTGTK